MWRIPNILGLIAELDEFIGRSKEKRQLFQKFVMNLYELFMCEIGMLATDHSCVMYTKLCARIEKMTKLLDIAGVRLSIPPGIILALVAFGIDYLKDKLTDESFYLSMPVL